jgi:hypothetical protein
VTTLDGTL